MSDVHCIQRMRNVITYIYVPGCIHTQLSLVYCNASCLACVLRKSSAFITCTFHQPHSFCWTLFVLCQGIYIVQHVNRCVMCLCKYLAYGVCICLYLGFNNRFFFDQNNCIFNILGNK